MIIYRSASLSRLEGKLAVFVLENGQEITVYKDELAGTAKEGAEFTLQLIPKAEADLEKDELARAILNQILADEPVNSSQKTDSTREDFSSQEDCSR